MTTYTQESSHTWAGRDTSTTALDPAMSMRPFRSNLEKQRFWLDPVAYVSKVHRAHGVLHAFGAGRPEFLFAFHPDLNRQLSDDGDLFHWSASKAWIGTEGSLSILRASVSNMDGKEYATRSRLMRPAFHHDLVERSATAIVGHTDRMLRTWRPGEIRDVHADIRLLVHAISMEAVLGLRDPQIVRRIYDLVDDIYMGSGSVWAMLLPFDGPMTPLRKVRTAADAIVALMRGIIQDKQRRGGSPADMLAMMMQARTEDGESLGETELVSETYNIMGHDTTVCALMWTLLLVALHPRVHRRLVDELAGVLRGAAPTAADLPRLTYLDATIKEALRLCPPQSVSRRFNTGPCRLGRYDLERRTVIFMSSFITHRLPDLYADPMRFSPERWQTLRPSPYEYFPFGAGLHVCVGRAFALLEMKLALAMILQRVTPSVPARTRIDRMRRARLLLGPRGEVPFAIAAPGAPVRAPAVRGDIRRMVALDVH